MKKLDLENKFLTFGKVSFNTSALVGLTKDKFKKQYGGALLRETDEVWKQISKYTKQPKSIKKSK